ncbi:hypothetical protein Ddc_15149 [Ditylenchus destructor]|nr:hypothetical protein Ddc_15149 [Ditylenchus destructor]
MLRAQCDVFRRRRRKTLAFSVLGCAQCRRKTPTENVDGRRKTSTFSVDGAVRTMPTFSVNGKRRRKNERSSAEDRPTENVDGK